MAMLITDFSAGSHGESPEIDFAPVYLALHIHELMGIRHEFEKHYRENRLVRLVLRDLSLFSLTCLLLSNKQM